MTEDWIEAFELSALIPPFGRTPSSWVARVNGGGSYLGEGEKPAAIGLNRFKHCQLD